MALALTSSNLHLQKNSASAIDKVRNLTDFNFAVAGDFGCGPKANQTVSNMAAKKPELVIALGDLSYQKDAGCWYNTVAPLDSKGILKIAI
jgi:phosphodiesterase/alkaline phosphatase D-like protein